MKKLVVALMVGTIVLSNGLQASAAGLKDVFDAKYYAGQYEDLQKAFGNDEEALYKHFVDYGLKEGRNMNPVIDIAKYRKQYGDLDKAFGDNWDAYVDHYFKYGIKENRDNGTNFDVKKYVAAYEDIQKAFGEDYEKAAKHYLEHGQKENRTKGNKSFTEAKSKVNVETPALPYTEKEVHEDSSWVIWEYDADGDLIKNTFYEADGSISFYNIYEYDENGNYYGMIQYDADGNKVLWLVEKYNEDNTICTSTIYEVDGSKTINIHNYIEYTCDIISYDKNGKFIDWSKFYCDSNWKDIDLTTYNEDGSVKQEYDLIVDEDGNEYFVPTEDSGDEDSSLERTETIENEDGSTCIREYDKNGYEIKETIYDPEGALMYYIESEYDENGSRVQATVYDAEGNKTINKYDRVNNIQTTISYWADGSFRGWVEDVLDENMNPIHYKEFDEQGNLIGEYTLEKDENGNNKWVPVEA